MRTIIAGSRDLHEVDTVCSAIAQAIAAGLHISQVVCGGASGVDTVGANLAQQYGIPVVWYQANWGLHGKAAGPMRNQQMADNADALIAIQHNGSRGTADMIRRGIAKGLKVYYFTTGPDVGVAYRQPLDEPFEPMF